jgi:hypothetical protein
MTLSTKSSTLDREFDLPPTSLRISVAISLFIIVVFCGIFALIIAERIVWVNNQKAFVNGDIKAINRLYDLKIANFLERLSLGNEAYASKAKVKKELNRFNKALEDRDYQLVVKTIYSWLKDGEISNLLEEQSFPYLKTIDLLKIVEKETAKLKEIDNVVASYQKELLETVKMQESLIEDWHRFLNIKQNLIKSPYTFYTEGNLRYLPKILGVPDNLGTIEKAASALKPFLTKEQLESLNENSFASLLRVKRSSFFKANKKINKIKSNIKNLNSQSKNKHKNIDNLWLKLKTDLKNLFLIFLAPPNL